jgi:hypothetical protein
MSRRLAKRPEASINCETCWRAFAPWRKGRLRFFCSDSCAELAGKRDPKEPPSGNYERRIARVEGATP